MKAALTFLRRCALFLWLVVRYPLLMVLLLGCILLAPLPWLDDTRVYLTPDAYVYSHWLLVPGLIGTAIVLWLAVMNVLGWIGLWSSWQQHKER